MLRELTEKQFKTLTLALACQRHMMATPAHDGRVIVALKRRGLLEGEENWATKKGVELFKSQLLARLPANKQATSLLLVKAGFLTVRRLETPKIGVGPKEIRLLADVEVLRRFKGGWMRGFELTDKGEGYLEA